ncbi:hypothetical protein ACQW02_05520 [Humitalea sp. 24SJ18S-53]|uniref:hypothetical protein n=1 Tax=Humitalea sp. 24SJ18S-53 TaxID=3422307 RepID=UPI003D679B0A
MALRASIADIMVANRLRGAAAAGVSAADINFAQSTDMAPEDVAALRATTRAHGLCIILRCPKKGAVAFHGVFRPKRWADGHDSQGNTVKSGLSGIGIHPEGGNIFVSDYDMMSLWVAAGGGGYRKIFCSSTVPGRDRGHWPREALETVRRLNAGLISPLQHGAQDDFTPAVNHPHPGVSRDGRFAAIREGEATYIEGMAACAAYYAQWGLYWPYDGQGKFTKAAAAPV